MKAIKIENNQPVAVYNADKQQLIGIFKSKTLISKYLNPNYPEKSGRFILDGLKRKIAKPAQEDMNLKCKLAFRYASDQQVAMLGTGDFYIAEGYPQLKKGTGFVDTKASLYKKQVLRK